MKLHLLLALTLIFSSVACSPFKKAGKSISTAFDKNRTHQIEETDLFSPHEMALRPETSTRRNIEIPLSDGNVLRGIAMIRLEPRANIIYFGGNAELSQVATTKITQWSEQYQINVFFVDHRGYGASTGSPAVKNLADDALQIFDGTSELRGDIPTIVVGYSIGSIPATYLAANRQVAGLALMAPLTSFSDKDLFPKKQKRKLKPWYRVPFAKLIKVLPNFDIPENNEPLFQITAVKAEVLLIHGEADDVIPAQCSKKLFELATSEKTLLLLPKHDHNNLSLTDGTGAIYFKTYLEKIMASESKYGIYSSH
ncbi:MAG: lysophospholipase [Holophagaceae bacterium]|nr:lysophospholipase [Holophagaceae bacterium]